MVLRPRNRSCGGVTGVSPIQPSGDTRLSTASLGLLLLVFFFHYKVVGDREYAGNTVDLDAGDLFIHLAGDHTFERNVPVFDDDVNGRNSTQLILAQDFAAEDGAVGGAADSVVLNGGGQDLDI